MEGTAPSPRSLFALSLLALLPRLAVVLALLNAPIGLDDMHQYDMLARSLASGKGYRWYGRADVARLAPYLRQVYGIDLPLDAVPEDGLVSVHRPPGYPLFLAGVYALAGFEGRLAAARLIQALLGAALAPLTALLAWRLGLGRQGALLAGTALALYPILWMYPAGLASENLFIPALLAGVVVLLRAGEARRLRQAALAGLLLGLATLTRGVLAPFVVLAALWLWRRSGLRPAVGFALCAALVTLPWAARNSLILDRPAFVENSLGYNLFIGYHPEGDGSFTVDLAVIPLKYLNDGAREAWAMEQALGFIRQDPGRVPILFLRRLANFWGLEDREVVYFYSNNFFGPIPQPWLTLAYLLLVAPLPLLALSASLGWRLVRRAGGLVLGLVGLNMAAYAAVLAEPRFHLPLVPYLAAFAAATWSTPGAVAAFLRDLRRAQPTALVSAAAALALLAFWAWYLARRWPLLTAVMGPGGNTLRLNY